MKTWGDNELTLAPLQGKTIAIVGYGNQGQAQAHNCRDSGLSVIIGGRQQGHSWQQATDDGFTVVPIEAIPHQADILVVLTPDDAIGTIIDGWDNDSQLADNHTIIVGHGLAFHAGWASVPPHVSAGLVAPKGQGKGVRDKYLSGSGVPALIGVHQSGHTSDDDTVLELLKSYAKAIGCGHGGVYHSSIAEETVCDLFSEQAVLCGGLSHLITAAFDTLVARGYSPEAAAIECQYEVKLIADLLHTKGITAMRQAISPAALFGDLTRGPRIIDQQVKETMATILDEIENGTFASEMRTQDTPSLRQLAQSNANQTLEATYQHIQAIINRR